MYNISDSKPLIERQQNYVLDRKLVTIHSEDRDSAKWKNSNNFEITLPETMEHVQSMRLIESNFPILYYTFSNNYQNTKFSFIVNPLNPTAPYYSILLDASNNGVEFTATISEGFYSPFELANELKNVMNYAINDYIDDISQNAAVYGSNNVLYNNVKQRLVFTNNTDRIIFLFNKKEEYVLSHCIQPNMWEKPINWGLPYYLGFERKIYEMAPSLDSSGNPQPIFFNFLPDDIKLITNTVNGISSPYLLEADFAPLLYGEEVIYMEIDRYNNYDEIVPFSTSTNSLNNNDYNGVVNSAFAKIPINANPQGRMNHSSNGFLLNLTHFTVPIEKIRKLKFKLRYHDGRLVEFNNNSFNFTIEFNMLRNEIKRNYNVRKPLTYQL